MASIIRAHVSALYGSLLHSDVGLSQFGPGRGETIGAALRSARTGHATFAAHFTQPPRAGSRSAPASAPQPVPAERVYGFSLLLQRQVSTWDDFVWLRPVNLSAAGVAAMITGFNLAIRSSWSRRVTFSGGVTAHRDGEDMQETIARADRLLCQAKHSGRDRIAQAA